MKSATQISIEPDGNGHIGMFGGRYVPETLFHAVSELSNTYEQLKHDTDFQNEINYYLVEYAGRPTPLTFAENLTRHFNTAKIYLKREDLNHTGSHKLNNVIGQLVVAKRMGKLRIIAETGAGQHGVATATIAALFGMKCVVYMGAKDIQRQELNVFRMKLLGAEVISVTSGSQTLKDATNEALRDWMKNVTGTHYVIGSVVGPHPYPTMVRDFQRIIGLETKKQLLDKENKLPTAILACVGGGSNAIGTFDAFLNDPVALYGIEAAGKGLETSYHAATLSLGTPGILHGAYSYLLQNADGQIKEAHSISAGLDYPGVGPQHSYLKTIGRVTYAAVTDKDAIEALHFLSKTEGIIPALESSHAIAYLPKIMPSLTAKDCVVITISGRGDKDMHTVMEQLRL